MAYYNQFYNPNYNPNPGYAQQAYNYQQPAQIQNSSFVPIQKYRLVKEDAQNIQKQSERDENDTLPIYVTKAEFEALREDVEKLRKELGE